jgi:hypothetical protein
VLIGIGVVVSQAPLSPVPLFFFWVVPFGFALFGLGTRCCRPRS